MCSRFWLATPPSPGHADGRPLRAAGAISMAVVFVYFMISAIGLGLFMLTRTYKLWGAAKSEAMLLGTAAENGVRAGLAAMEEIFAGRAFPLDLTNSEYAALRTATLSGGTETAAALLGAPLPLSVAGADGDAEWEAELDFAPERVCDSGSFFSAAFFGSIAGRGRLARRIRAKRAALEIGIEAMAGRIPLSAFPFLLSGENAPRQAAELLASGGIALAPPENGGGPLAAAATETRLLSSDVSLQLAETLRIKIFSPDGLTIAELRRALGLPLVNEPVPDGVYLAVNDAGLGGVFVQGDVEEMILAAEGGRQHIQFRLEEGTWRLWFNPAEHRTEFLAPEEIRAFDRSPLPIIMVNGGIASLAGGIVDELGTLAPAAGTDSPSILAGVSLTIVSSGETVITSHLIQEGVRWTDGIPYLKDATAQLFLQASGADFVSGAETNGRIRIGEAAPVDLHLQASLAARDGIIVEGKDRTVTVSGGLQTTDLDVEGNRLNIRPDARLLSGLQAPGLGPRAAVPVLCLLGWEARQWSD